MNTFSKITLALLAAAFVSSTPAIAAESAAPASPKAGLTDALKSRASDVIGDAQQGIDEKAAKIRDAIDARPREAAKPRVMEKTDVVGSAQQGTDTRGAQIKDTIKDNTRIKKARTPRSMEKSDVIGEAQQGTDTKGAQIKDPRSVKGKKGAKPCQTGKAPAGQEEIVQVEQQTVTVETPNGVAQETVTTITPEGPANAQDALSKAAKDAVDAGKDAAKDAAKDALKNAVKGAAGK